MKFGEVANIVQNNKKVAGQYVPHVHFNVIPRFEGDKICVEKWEAHKYKDGEMREVARKLKPFFKE
jgi:diadenosine tetraphosphate (Ap4A) HIT family hydrolase